ncbi:MAG: cation transporter [Methylovirgula sp.]|jgi:Co/Zn/Cd efflux system component
MNDEAPEPRSTDGRLLSTLRLVIFLNLAYFGIELAVALAIGSVALIADSVDFLEDMTVNGLILAGLRFAPVWRARLGMGLASLLLLPAAAGVIMLLHKIQAPVPPAPLPLSVTGLGALVVNGTCAVLLARVRNEAGSLTRAAFLSARNDAIANVAIIAAGGATALWPTIWPDLIVGAGIALLNADSAREIFEAAREEHKDAREG